MPFFTLFYLPILWIALEILRFSWQIALTIDLIVVCKHPPAFLQEVDQLVSQPGLHENSSRRTNNSLKKRKNKRPHWSCSSDSAFGVWTEALGIPNTKDCVRRWSFRHIQALSQCNQMYMTCTYYIILYVWIITCSKCVLQKKDGNSLVRNQAFVGLRKTKHLWWEALARKNSREMVQKLIEEAGRSRGTRMRPRDCMRSIYIIIRFIKVPFLLGISYFWFSEWMSESNEPWWSDH